MSVIMGFTASNTVEVTNVDAVSDLLDSYKLHDFELKDLTLRCFNNDYGFPHALADKNCSLLDDEDFEEFSDELVKLLEEHGDADFINLLQDLSPYLTSELTIQSIIFSICEFPIDGKEWHVKPGSSMRHAGACPAGKRNVCRCPASS